MNRILMAICAASLALSAAPAAFADTRGSGGAVCQPNDKGCTMPVQKSGKAPAEGKSTAKSPAKSTAKKDGSRGPQVSDSGAKGAPFKQAGNSRFKTPPKGQEYRVVNERLVLVDKQTMQIVTVVGLLSALVK